jgi:hypothetical protein
VHFEDAAQVAAAVSTSLAGEAVLMKPSAF